MPRPIKRYGSRKLYDASESRYVSLEELASYIRAGEAVRVVDAHSGDDLTALTLTQLLTEEERRGQSPLTPELLHALIRGSRSLGGAVPGGTRAPASRARSLRRVRAELAQLRAHLELLARSLDDLEADGDGPARRRRRTSA